MNRDGWNGAKTALTAVQWLRYAESKPGSYEVLIDDQSLMHYPVSYDIALGAFSRFASRGGRVRLVEAGNR